MKFIDVIPLTYPEFLTYNVSDETSIKVGQLVEIPFGRKVTRGVVARFTKKPSFKTREAKGLGIKAITHMQTALLNQLSQFYFCSARRALEEVFPTSDITVKNSEALVENKRPERFLLLEKHPFDSYSKITARQMNRDKQALIIFPDIGSLEKFERESKSFLKKYRYAKITARSKTLESLKDINGGKIQLVIGTRTSLFLPYFNLSLIIIHQEYSSGHKEEKTPRYNSLEVAEFMQTKSNLTVIAQSDTVTLDNFFKLKEGYKKIDRLKKSETLIKIINEPLFPAIGTVIENIISDNIRRDRKTGIFINNKGKSPFLFCVECKEIKKCPQCDVAMKTEKNFLSCPSCKRKEERKIRCQKCGSTHLKIIETGIEKVKKEIRKYFPQAPLLIAKGGAGNSNDKNEKEAKIILGTSALENIGLQGLGTLIILYPEEMWNLPLYNSEQKAHTVISSLISKVGNDTNIFVKTSDPENKVLKAIKDQGYGFFKEKLSELKEYQYPPFADVISIETNNKKGQIESLLKFFKDKIIGEPVELTIKNKKFLVIRAGKNTITYDTILKSPKGLIIERNPEGLI